MNLVKTAREENVTYLTIDGLTMFQSVESRVILYQHISSASHVPVPQNERLNEEKKHIHSIQISVNILRIAKEQNSTMKRNVPNQ